MAKAKEIACDDPRADPQEWLAGVLCIRFDEVVDYCPAALSANDIKGVHDMRVATRRLRSLLRDFEEVIGKLPIKHARKELKKLSDMLGSVRDQDVAIIALEKLSTKTQNEPIKTGIETVTGEHRELRLRAHIDLSKTFSIETIEDLHEAFKAATDAARGEPGLFRPVTVEAAGREVISARLADLCELGKSMYDPYNNKALHKLRIRAKRLRYAIELFAVCLGNSIVPFAEEVARLQSRLGEVHDCDVWIKNLSKRLKNKNGKMPESSSEHEAAMWLQSEFVRKRAKEYRSALELWGEWETSGFEDRLRAVISQSPEPR